MKRTGFFSVAGLLIVPLFFCIFFSGCGKTDKGSASLTKASGGETFFAVAVTPTLKGSIQEYLETNGEVISKVCVDVFPDNNGKITRFLKRLGNYVREGEAIGYIDPSRPGQTFSLSSIRAPISGTITSLPYRAGATVSMQSSVAKISRLDQTEIVTYVAERFFSHIRLGQKALVKFDAYPGLIFEGKIVELAPFINSSKRTLELKIGLIPDPQKPPVEVGMFAEIRLIIEDKAQVVKIPSSAVAYRNGCAYVFVVKKKTVGEEKNSVNLVEKISDSASNMDTQAGLETKDRVEQRKIQEGIFMDGQVEVLSGLQEGELVVVRGQNSLADGSGIRIIEIVKPQTSANKST